MIRQPFDFSGRTGKIEFGVDGPGYQLLDGYPEINITQDPKIYSAAINLPFTGHTSHWGAQPRNRQIW
jgi:hypothetical protein